MDVPIGCIVSIRRNRVCVILGFETFWIKSRSDLGFRIRVVIHAGSDHEDWVQLYVVQTYHKTKCSIGEVFSQALKKLRLIVIVIVIRTTWHVCQYRLKLGGLVADFRDS